MEPKQLCPLVGRRSPQGQGDVVRLPIGDAHVLGHSLTGNDGCRRLLETEQPIEVFGFIEVGHRDGDVIKSTVRDSPRAQGRRGVSEPILGAGSDQNGIFRRGWRATGALSHCV